MIFMEQLNFSVGLDIGTTKIVALVGKKMNIIKLKFWVLENQRASVFIGEL